MTGFFELARANRVRLAIIDRTERGTAPRPLVHALIEGRRVVYDTFDGYNLQPDRAFDPHRFDDDLDEVDFYFKRSFDPTRHGSLSNAAKVRPLGLNYQVSSRSNTWREGTRPFDPWRYLSALRRRSSILSPIVGRPDTRDLYIEDFESPPRPPAKPLVLFVTRLWDPATAGRRDLAEQRRAINEFRLRCVRQLRRELGASFIGGLAGDRYARACFPDHVLPRRTTFQRSFLRRIREATICVATTGLHGSIGWKMAEYVAAARAIVSEPLEYELPGEFRRERNYLEFRSPGELIEAVQRLMTDAARRDAMMCANWQYYREHVRPDALVMNTIRAVLAQG